MRKSAVQSKILRCSLDGSQSGSVRDVTQRSCGLIGRGGCCNGDTGTGIAKIISLDSYGTLLLHDAQRSD